MEISVVDNPVWKPYLFDWWGNNYARRIVRFQRKNWFVKCVPRDNRSAYREYLAYLLGRNFANIAEVRLLSHSQFDSIKQLGVQLPEGASQSTTCLVRLAFDYHWLRLPVKSLERAVASELVYSLWIRRRDAHSFNRVYVQGVPIFFDHSTGILGEPELLCMDKFFHKGPDAGYAAWWQLEEKRSMRNPDILLLRRREKDIFAPENSSKGVFHPVRRKDKFRKLLFDVVRQIQSIPHPKLSRMSEEAGFNNHESAEILDFLTVSNNGLSAGVDRLCSMFNLS